MMVRVFMAIKNNIVTFWVMTRYSLLDRYQRPEEYAASVFKIEALRNFANAPDMHQPTFQQCCSYTFNVIDNMAFIFPQCELKFRTRVDNDKGEIFSLLLLRVSVIVLKNWNTINIIDLDRYYPFA
jgi:hypothetical protein